MSEAVQERSKDSIMTMLDRMRRHKGWLKWSLALVVLAFVVFYIPEFPATTTAIASAPRRARCWPKSTARPSRPASSSGATARRCRPTGTAYGGEINEQLLRQLGIDQQILKQMVDEQAALVEAERQGIRVSDEELAQQIFAIPASRRTASSSARRATSSCCAARTRR